MFAKTDILIPPDTRKMARIISNHLKSLLTHLKSLVLSWLSFIKNGNRLLNSRLLDVTSIVFNSKPTGITVLDQMVNFTFKSCVVRVALALPVLYVKFFHSLFLILKRLYGNLLSVGKISSIEILASWSPSRSFSWNFDVVWLSHFFNIQIKHVQFLLFYWFTLFIGLSFIHTSILILLHLL